MPNTAPLVLAVNGGSSSLKYGLFTLALEPRPVCQGSVGGGGTATVVDRILAGIAPDLETGVLAGIVHRVVHGGERFVRPQRVTTETLAGLRTLDPAGAESPARGDRADRDLRPRPARHAAGGVLRYRVPSRPSRGQSHAAGCRRRQAFAAMASTVCPTPTCSLSSNGLLARRPPRGRVVLAHLGNGASLAAVVNGRCLDTSMGLTPIRRPGHEQPQRRPRPRRCHLSGAHPRPARWTRSTIC